MAEQRGDLGHPLTAVGHVNADRDAWIGLVGSETLDLPDHRRGRYLDARLTGGRVLDGILEFDGNGVALGFVPQARTWTARSVAQELPAPELEQPQAAWQEATVHEGLQVE